MRLAVSSTARGPPASLSVVLVSMMAMPPRVHDAYTKEEDAFLWANKDQSLDEVADLLGRGSKSCAMRLDRLRNPKTEGHRRLFGCAEEDSGEELKSLRPVRDCLLRITHDPSLRSEDFRVGYSDRFHAAAREVSFDEPNTSVRGGERALVLALPEHRIQYVKFRRRLVWHKALRRDDFFGSRGGLRIQQVVSTYAQWDEARRRRMRQATRRAGLALGSAEALGFFREALVAAVRGEMEAEDLASLALSEKFFGRRADAGAGRDDTTETCESVAALLQLVETLPDEHHALRDEVVRRVRAVLVGF